MSTTRKDILAAAICEFARVGFSGASTLAIARAAETRQPLLNYHYGTKEKLWQAATDFGFVELTVAFDSISETTGDMSPLNILKLMLRTINRFATRHPRHVDIFRQEMGSDSPQTDYLLKQYLIPVYAHLNAVIEAAIAADEIKPLPPQFLSSLFLGATTHFFTAGPTIEAVYALDVADAKQARQHGDWLVEIIFDGLTKTAGD
ncbi:MAG: TetR family transcriptional regulator [Gammaproteobacteria bacterium]|nr:TetR family transcriptional regulator [Gammaproteobacteria bacterium]